MKRWKKMLFVAVAWMGLFVAGEAVVRVVYWARGDVPPTSDASLENEWEWARAHLRAGQAVFESALVFDPDTGWSNRPNLDTGTVRTNAEGMRNRESFERRPGRKRLLFLGDSYTFGAGVGDEETFAHLLAAGPLKDWDVLNMAVPGTGTDQQVIAFEARGAAYEPDVVVLGFFLRDYSRNILSFRDYAKPRFVPDGDGLRLTNHPVIPPEELYAQYASGVRRIGRWDRSYLVCALARAFARRRDDAIAEWAPGWQVLSRLMTRFKAQVEAAGGLPVWLIIPYRDVLTEDAEKWDALAAMCAAHAKAVGLPCLDLCGPFRERARLAPQEEIFLPKSEGGHLAPAGHRLVAVALSKFLSDAGAIGPLETLDRKGSPPRSE